MRARTASAGVARTPCGSLRSIGCVFVSDAWARPPRAARLGFHSWIAARIGDKSALAARVHYAIELRSEQAAIEIMSDEAARELATRHELDEASLPEVAAFEASPGNWYHRVTCEPEGLPRRLYNFMRARARARRARGARA